MAEPAVMWGSPTDAGRRRLRPADDDDLRLADFRARVREAGERWTTDRRDELAGLLAEAAAGDPELAELARIGGSVLEDFLDGFRRQAGADQAAAPQHDLASDLIDGREVAPEVLAGLASRYLVAVVRYPDAGRGRPALHETAGSGVLKTRRDNAVVLLVPDVDPERTERITKQLTQCLAGKGWLALAERPTNELADGYAEATDVMRLVVASRRPGGAYRISDVLVEYAVTSHARVAENLAAVIKPLRAHNVLWETLTVLIDADYNRNKAARDLFIHRSTLDYRLQRIAGITGFDPTNGRGAQLLTAAIVADAVAAAG